MTDIHILPVTNRKQRKQFLNLPWSLYADDPNWIPPLLMQQKEMLGFTRHPFYDQADGQARVAALDNRTLLYASPDPTAWLAPAAMIE